MKKRKFNILLNIAVLCMCVCAIAIGVYSAKTASLNVSGTIGFTAHNCKVRVLGKITGAVDENNNALDPATTQALKYQESEDTGKLIDGTADTWSFGSIYFDDINTDKYHEVNDIVFTFTITNESAYYVDVTVNRGCINNNRIFIYAPNNGETLAPKDQGGSSVTLTVKLQLQKVGGEYSSLGDPISLSNATLLNFTKSQAPSYLATDWKSKITGISSATSISFVKEIDESIKSNSSYTPINVGALNATSAQSELTNNKNVTDIIAYYNSTNKEVIVYSPARIYAPQDCSSMFSNCGALTSLDLSNFNTSKVTNMSNMFNSCGSLTSLDLSNFNTSSVTDMSNMFTDCNELASLDVSNFNTSSVTNMSYMFGSCFYLASLDLSNFNTSSVTNMSSMFKSCGQLVTIYVNSSKWVISPGCNTDNMFESCACAAVTPI
ncbi:MAG: BspA family leucine-rich repeat surface protein [Eubacteriales bacterium]|nr:BspA family leucine-rich repeat surface protein [Eubacteriales bacterium]